MTTRDKQNNITTLARRLRPFLLSQVAASPAASSRSLNRIIRVPSGTAEVSVYPKTDAGLASAISAASAGDVIWLPPYSSFANNYTLPGTVSVFAMGQQARFTGQVTLSSDTQVDRVEVVRSASDAGTLSGFVGPSSGRAYIHDCYVTVTNSGAGDACGLYQPNAGTVWAWNTYAYGNASGGGSGYGARGAAGFIEYYGGKLDGSTARALAASGSSTQTRYASAAAIAGTSLWNGSSNDSPPANWETVAYDDSAWGTAVAKSDWAVVISGADTFWTSDTGAGRRSLFRDSFTLSVSSVVSATLYWDADDAVEGVYVNGTLVDSWTTPISGDDHGVRAVDVLDELDFSGSNVIAISSTNTYDTSPAVGGAVTFKLVINSGTGAVKVHAAEGVVSSTEEPMRGDRSAWDVDNYSERHASDIENAVYKNHLPTPTGVAADAGKPVILNTTANAYTLGAGEIGDIEISINNVSNPPTEAELITAFGPPDEFADDKKIGILDDNGADSNLYAVFSDMGHYWLLPLAKASVASLSVTVNSTTTLASNSPDWYGRAALERLDDGTWVLCYREGSAHDVNDGSLHIRFSDDEGATWTAEDTDLDGNAVSGFPMNPSTLSAGEDAGEPWLMLAPNGTLILHMWRVDYSVTANGTYQSTSTDGGKTWSASAQIDFSGIADDTLVFTTEDHFVLDGVIYAGARLQDDVTATNIKSILIKSTDNGATWEYVSDVSSYATDTWEWSMEYVGNNTIIALLRDKLFLKTYKSISTDLGATWSALSDITTAFGGAVMGRTRMSTRAHLKGLDNWWQDSVLIVYGFEHVDPGFSQNRRNAIWISQDRGTTWNGPYYVAAEVEDAGYGDMLYSAATDEYIFISYQGSLAEADLVQYNLDIGGL